jgi:hypothetical protein
MTRCFRLAPATYGPKLQDFHSLCWLVLRTPVGWNAPHTGSNYPKFVTQHGDFEFQPVDFRFRGTFVIDEGLSAGKHCDSNKADRVEDGVTNVGFPILG